MACNGTSTGSATVNVSGNISGTVTYLWNNGETTSSINNLAAGQYICTVTNGNGCTSTQQVIITEPNTPLSGPLDVINETCGASNGVCSISVSGGTAPYAISWNNGGTGASINNLSAGTYQATVTDANGCVLLNTVTLTNSGVGTIGTIGTVTGTKNGVCPGTTKIYSIPAVSNATNYTWTAPANSSITSGQGTNSIKVLFGPGFTSGNLTVTANNSCVSTSTISTALKSTPSIPGTIKGPISNVCGATTTYYISSVLGATSYTWSVPAGATVLSGQGTTSISVLWPSTSLSSQSVCVTANNACGISLAKCLTGISTLPLKPVKVTGPLSV